MSAAARIEGKPKAQTMDYHFTKKVSYTFPQAQEKAIAALQEEGFGVISEIDLKEKFKEKLGIDFRNYKILGACNPKLALRAIEQEDKIGTMLPCNVLVQEHENGQVEVTAINPMEAMSGINNAALQAVATEVSQKLKTVLDRL
jgi:uncharacterized protein (DUF302 family)